MDDIGMLESLLDVQGVDSEIDRLHARRSSLPILEDFREAHGELQRLEGEIAEQSRHARDTRLALDRAEGEMLIDEEKATKEEHRLFAGGLTAREATHMRDEVAMLRKRVSDREDEVIELMELRQQYDQRLAELEAQRVDAAATKARLDEEIRAEWAAIDGQVATLRDQREGLASKVDPDLLELYDGIRPSKDGVAAAVLADRVCGGCHLALSAAEESQALKAQPPRCLHCRRILVPR
ncbi:MAG TPA: hypothetical protein VMM81_08760 [Acidimicrobiia bacterium]|nr:hypothetical protein [Acidimicrobiia bacterium]